MGEPTHEKLLAVYEAAQDVSTIYSATTAGAMARLHGALKPESPLPSDEVLRQWAFDPECGIGGYPVKEGSRVIGAKWLRHAAGPMREAYKRLPTKQQLDETFCAWLLEQADELEARGK